VLVTDEDGESVLTAALSEVRPCKVFRNRLDSSRDIARHDSNLGRSVLVGLLVPAVLVVIMQADLRTAPVAEGSDGYQLTAAPTGFPLVAVRFVPRASLADITKLLDAYSASLVDGPRPGGFYKLRIGSPISSPSELARIVGEIARENVVEFAAVAE
jgi:hypothetical protein